MYDEFLFKNLFYFGLNEHSKSQLDKSLFPGGEFNGSLRGLRDYALLYAGSSFTVGVAETQELAESAPEPAPSPACPFDPACLLISSLSAACPDLALSLLLILSSLHTPVTTFDHCLSDHLLSINKAAIGSNYTASSLQHVCVTMCLSLVHVL